MIARLARTTAAVCVVTAILFALWTRNLAGPLGVLGGGLLIGISLWAITASVDDLLLRFQSETSQKRVGFSLVKFFTRHAIVALAAYGMMVRLHLDPVGLLLGVSSLGVATAVDVLKGLRWRRFP